MRCAGACFPRSIWSRGYTIYFRHTGATFLSQQVHSLKRPYKRKLDVVYKYIHSCEARSESHAYITS